MMIHGHCSACGEYTRIGHRTGLCEWCEDKADRVADPLWEADNSFFSSQTVRNADDAAGFALFLRACQGTP